MKPRPSPLWIDLENTSREQPSSVAWRVGPTSHSWRAVHEHCTQFALKLRSLGVQPGDRVALLANNGLAGYTAYFAAAGVGAILAPLNTRLHRLEQTKVLDRAGATLVLCDPAHREEAASFGRPVQWLEETIDEPELVGAADSFAATPVQAKDTAHLYFTSGTTGEPKGVMLTHGNVASHAKLACEALDITEVDRWAHIAPMFHLADAWAVFAITRAGGSHVAMPRFDAQGALQLMGHEGVTITNLVPTMLHAMLDAAPAAPTPFPNLRLVLSGGAPIAPTTVERILASFAPADYAQTYGLTETSPYLTLSRIDSQIAKRPAAAQLAFRCRTGRPMKGVSLRVVDDAAEPVPKDDRAVGEIHARGPTVTPGYFNDEDATASAFTEDGWFRTGDLATVDADNSVRIVDRKKDVILTGGETVYSIEVENVLFAHPWVRAAAVFGVPDPKWGESVTAAVVIDATNEDWQEALDAHCRGGLASYKCPKTYLRLDALPKGGSGKVQKRLLVDRVMNEKYGNEA